VTRPRLAKLQRVAREVADAARRRRSSAPKRPEGDTADELARRLDATRERLRREIPPSDED
jgi:hypothetical protein